MDAARIPDEFELFERIYNYRRSIQHIEREYLDIRVRLRDAEADLRSDSQNRELKAQVEYLDFLGQTIRDSILHRPIGRNLESCSMHGEFFPFYISQT